jgi:hypothetical protein
MSVKLSLNVSSTMGQTVSPSLRAFNGAVGAGNIALVPAGSTDGVDLVNETVVTFL